MGLVKRDHMSWLGYIKKNFAIIPLVSITTFSMSCTGLFILYAIYKCDTIMVRNDKYPWDRMGLLANPRNRKILTYHQTFHNFDELDDLYKQMEEKEKELFD